MSFQTIAAMAEDRELLSRVSSCVAVLKMPNPFGWPYEWAWQLAASEGWAEAYVDGGITDEMIVEAVRRVAAENSPYTVGPETEGIEQ